MHVNWWELLFIVSTLAKNAVSYMPLPGSSAGFISSPWYPMIYHGVQSGLALNFAGSNKVLSDQRKEAALEGK